MHQEKLIVTKVAKVIKTIRRQEKAGGQAIISS